MKLFELLQLLKPTQDTTIYVKLSNTSTKYINVEREVKFLEVDGYNLRKVEEIYTKADTIYIGLKRNPPKYSTGEMED